MTSIDCTPHVPNFPACDCAARCIHCGSTAISDSGVGTVYCADCGAHENDCGIFPLIDAFESFVTYFAPAYESAHDPYVELPRKRPATPYMPVRERIA